MHMLATVSKTGSLYGSFPATIERKAWLRTKGDLFCGNSAYSCQKRPLTKAGLKQPGLLKGVSVRNLLEW